MKRKKNFRYGKIASSVAIVFAILAVNSTCPFATYQPKLPKSAKHLQMF